MADEHQSEMYLENCIQRKSIDKILYILYKTSEVMLTTLTIIQSEENRLKINWPIANTCNAIHVEIRSHSCERLSFGHADKSVWWMPWH